MNSSHCFKIRSRLVSPATSREIKKFLTPREHCKDLDSETDILIKSDPFSNLVKGENRKLQPVILKHKKTRAVKFESLKSIALKGGERKEKEARNPSFLPNLKNEKSETMKCVVSKSEYKKDDSVFLRERNNKKAEQKLLKIESYLEVSFGIS